MEEMKHTPGPWIARTDTYPIMVESKTETHPVWNEIGEKEGDAQAFVCNTGSNTANARLIAAAPELLEALQAMLDAEPGYEYGGLSAEELAAHEKAQAAIAKATTAQQ